jgi:hypothetical protein
VTDLVEWSRYIEQRLERPPLICCIGKKPVDTGWTTGPWDQPDEWRARLAGWTGNVAMLTGRGLLVLDVDLHKPQAEGAFEALVATTKLNLETITVITPRGGRHYYFKYDPRVRVPSVALDMFGYPGIDCKADGGCVLLPPSRGS